MRRSLMHRRGLWHHGADVWIYNSKGEVLVQKRSMKKRTNPGLWTGSATGHVPAGETPRQSAVRELYEEIGVSAKPKELKEIIKTILVEEIGSRYHNREHLHVYLCKRDVDARNFKLQKEEVSAVKFVPFSRFRKEINDPQLAKKYVRTIYYPELIKKLGEVT